MTNISGKFNFIYSVRRTGRAFLFLFLAWGLTGCSSFRTFTTQSRVPDRQIVVDGRSDDWAGNLFVAKEEGVALGFLNDQEFLYICLRADRIPVRSQIIRSGLTVWFDAKGGNKKALGIKFPIGIRPDEWPMPRGEYGEDEEEPDIKKRGEEGSNELEIIRSDKDEPEKMEVAAVKGIEIKALPSRSGLVYELKIPLVRSDEYPIAVGAGPGATLGIGFETGKFDLNSMRRPGRMPGTGGMPPMGGGMMRGGMGRMGGRGAFPMPEDIKIWATVKLSSGESREPAAVLSLSQGY
jgi:hypothetical protein